MTSPGAEEGVVDYREPWKRPPTRLPIGTAPPVKDLRCRRSRLLSVDSYSLFRHVSVENAAITTLCRLVGEIRTKIRSENARVIRDERIKRGGFLP